MAGAANGVVSQPSPAVPTDDVQLFETLEDFPSGTMDAVLVPAGLTTGDVKFIDGNLGAAPLLNAGQHESTVVALAYELATGESLTTTSLPIEPQSETFYDDCDEMGAANGATDPVLVRDRHGCAGTLKSFAFIIWVEDGNLLTLGCQCDLARAVELVESLRPYGEMAR